LLCQAVFDFGFKTLTITWWNI